MELKSTHWSYSFGIHTSNLGDRYREGTNPFTGKTTRFPIDDGLTDSEIAAIKQVFKDNGFKGPEPDGDGYAIYGRDGSSLRFRFRDLDSDPRCVSGTVEIVVKKLNTKIIGFVLDVARAGNMVITNGVRDALVLDRDPDAQLKSRWPDAKKVSSVSELGNWITKTVFGHRVRQDT
ncbi:hypothetical protein Pla110_16740 [Polystyrenella longa]|uniref:Uncharacterized protein n=1 Tax=Polystyrenella longa TaxID=2528007 RepID=A0A518CL45_9PLAN|nr:hypothetical protein [Polystyrenella longa]QDU79952.1 hypothetical protein Pla110_16740 [Polystyrenella longa]